MGDGGVFPGWIALSDLSRTAVPEAKSNRPSTELANIKYFYRHAAPAYR
jgi:hypothetical protein